MKTPSETLGETVAVLVQCLGAVAACLLLVGWAWSLAAGSVLGFVLLLLLGALFVAPLVAWALPGAALGIGLLTQAVVSLIDWRRSRT